MSTSTWSDRRGLFQKGKEVHEPGRRMSGSGGGVIDAVRRASTSSNSDKGFSPLGNDPASPSSPTSQRRRVCVQLPRSGRRYITFADVPTLDSRPQHPAVCSGTYSNTSVAAKIITREDRVTRISSRREVLYLDGSTRRSEASTLLLKRSLQLSGRA